MPDRLARVPEPPVRGPGFTCHLCGVYLSRQGRVHEDITEARACSLHLSMLISYAPPEEWGCARCLPLQVPHHLIVTPCRSAAGLTEITGTRGGEEVADVDTDSLPPTQYLVLEVLAARARLGEACWTFPSRLKPALNAPPWLRPDLVASCTHPGSRPSVPDRCRARGGH